MSKKICTIIFGILLMLFGTTFIVSSDKAFGSIVLVIGIILIVYASIGIVSAILSKNPYASFTIGSSILLLIFGIILVSNADGTVKIITIILGIWLFISGLSSLIFTAKITKDMKALVGPITRIILGVISFVIPSISTSFVGAFLGVILILSGISTIVNVKNEETIYKVKVKK